MSVTSEHLTGISHAARSGSHIVLRGHVGDAVLLDGDVLTEEAAIETVLHRDAGIEVLLLADLADGLLCADPGHDERIAAVLEPLAETDPVRLGVRGAYEIALTVRALMEQTEVPVAVYMRDPGIMVNLLEEQGRRAFALLREAMDGATHTASGPAPVRNLLILNGVPATQSLEGLAARPGVSTVTANEPDLAARRAVLQRLRERFHGSAGANPRKLEAALDSLARATHGTSIRGLEQLRKHSHRAGIPVTRPERLVRSAQGDRAATPIERVGVGTIMSMLESRIMGQPQAMAEVREALERGRFRKANREPGGNRNQPLAVLMLHGPPGVGKTELAEILAEALCGSREGLTRIDCAEFQGEHDIARLLGSPPGYVGHEAGGALHRTLGAPVSVILLDEVDRAQGRFEEVLLGILDAGRLTDGRGHTAYFRNAVVVMTTNHSMKRLEGRLSPLPETEQFLEMSTAEVKRAVRTDRERGGIGSEAFASRLEAARALVAFDFLREPAVAEIVKRSCRNIATNLADELGIEIEFDTAAFGRMIAEVLGPPGPNEGEAPLRGWDGRTVRLEIDSRIEVPARMALDQADMRAGTRVRISPDGDGVKLEAR